MSRSVQSLERGLVVLEALIRNGPSGVTDLAHELELDKTIVHRLLRTLQGMGYVTQDANRKYTVGSKLRQIGAKAITSLDLRVAAAPFMHQLVEHTKGVAHLAKMAESRAIYIDRVQYPGLTLASTDVGGVAPGYCSAAGKVLWAYLPPLELNELLEETEFRAHTSHTITDRDTLLRHLAQIREQGVAIDMEEHRFGLIGVGAPVLDYNGNVIASICIGQVASRTDEQRIAETVELVREVSRRLSGEMGYVNGDL
ncbi:MAG TPA: IclR family transcriptional regulator [Oceanobacillus sp.]|nr:IclR family transcriptional regulator [Oceanobacillus sp.]